MTERFALFMWNYHDANGGIGDLAFVGSIEECMKHAESKPGDDYAAEIVNPETLTLVKHRESVLVESYLTAVPNKWRDVWVDDPTT
jgi:hypothetical protein